MVFEMYELIDFTLLVRGEKYFIRYIFKDKNKNISKIKFGRFHDYYYNSAIFKNMLRNANTNLYYGEKLQKFHKSSLFYKIITFKQYREKLIEKFKETALRIVLKRIVNEDFEWIR